MAYDPRKAAGAGTENFDSALSSMPFLNIVQKGSPEFDETHAQYAKKKVDGCKPGSIIFAPDRVVLPAPVRVIPLAQCVIYTEWKPRLQGGGYLGVKPLSIATQPGYRKGTAPGQENKEFFGQNELVFTIYVALLFQQGPEWKKGIIAFTGTQLKHARGWLNNIKQVKYTGDLADVKPPIFAATYTLATGPESNSKGSWFGWKIALDRVLDFTKDEALLSEAEASCKDAVLSLPTTSEGPKALPSSETPEEAF